MVYIYENTKNLRKEREARMKKRINLETEVINSVEFYPNGDIRMITLNRHLRTKQDYAQYYKEFEIQQRAFYDKRNER